MAVTRRAFGELQTLLPGDPLLEPPTAGKVRVVHNLGSTANLSDGASDQFRYADFAENH
jgi:hypothetical protein